MANGDEMLDELKFEELIKSYSPAEQFLARQIWDLKRDFKDVKDACSTLSLSKKQIAAGVGGVGTISTLVAIVVQMITKYIVK